MVQIAKRFLGNSLADAGELLSDLDEVEYGTS